MKKYTSLILFLVFTLNSCSEDDAPRSTEGIPEGTNLRVNYFTTNCTGLFEQQCLLIQEKDDLGTDNWDYFYAPIEDFDFEAGFIYNLEIKKTEIENPPADAPTYTYKLVRIISKTLVECNFSDPVKDLDWLRFEIDKREANPTEGMKYCFITQGELDGKAVFVYWDCNPFVNKIFLVYDCLGGSLGYLGNASINPDEIEGQKIVWQPPGFLCQPSF